MISAAYSYPVADRKRALITGITGQDGSYLAELLLGKGYEVHGILRRSSSFNTARIDHFFDDPQLHRHLGDITDAGLLVRLLLEIRPHEIYHLAAMSHVRVSFELPSLTMDVNAGGTVKLMEAIRAVGLDARIYNASSSEVFGRSDQTVQDENSPFRPVSPYGFSKAAAHFAGQVYRDGYGLPIWNGIAFNHESSRRGETFVTRKITRGLAQIIAGKARTIALGNVDAVRDWGHAPEYVEAMWRMLQKDTPKDYVIATGSSHAVRDFLSVAFELVGRDWADYVEFAEAFYRPVEVPYLCGDASRARHDLGWDPVTPFEDLVSLMVKADLEREGLTLEEARSSRW